MRRLIRSDLRRILKKKNLYIFSILLYVVMYTFKNGDSAEEQLELLKSTMASIGLIFVSIPVIMGVYGDEFKSGSMQIVIGRGLSRAKVIIAKLLDSFILTLMIYAGMAVVILVKNMLSGLVFSPRQTAMLMVAILFAVIRGTGYYAISGFFMILSWSVPVGMILDMVLILLLSPVLQIIQGKININVYDNSFDGLLDRAYNAIIADNFCYTLIPALLLICVSVAATVIVFNRKELEL